MAAILPVPAVTLTAGQEARVTRQEQVGSAVEEALRSFYFKVQILQYKKTYCNT